MTEKPKLDMNLLHASKHIKNPCKPHSASNTSHIKRRRKNVNELTDILGISQSNLSQHLALMRQAGILTTRKQGTSIYYGVINPKINIACDMVREVLLDQLKQKQEIVNNFS